jgi:hypothetical protein
MSDIISHSNRRTLSAFIASSMIAFSVMISGCDDTSHNDTAGRPVDLDEMPPGEVENFTNITLIFNGEEYAVYQGFKIQTDFQILDYESLQDNSVISINPNTMFGIEDTENNLAIYYGVSNVIVLKDGQNNIVTPIELFSDITITPQFYNQSDFDGSLSIDVEDLDPISLENGSMYAFDLTGDGQADFFVETKRDESNSVKLNTTIYIVNPRFQLLDKNTIEETIDQIINAGRESA